MSLLPETTITALESLNDRPTGLRAWLPSSPRDLAGSYLRWILLFLSAGVVMALLLRFELLTPAGDRMSSTTFGTLFSLHGAVMFFFVLLPAFPLLLAHALLPVLAAQAESPFPRLAVAAGRLFAAGGVLLLASALHGMDMGWTFDAPLTGRYATPVQLLAPLGVLLGMFALILNAIDRLTLLLMDRDRTWSQGTPFETGLALGLLLLLVAAPTIALCMVLFVTEGHFAFGMFGAEGLGDPLLLRKIFWMGATPALYAVLLPALGVLGTIAERASGQRLPLRRWTAPLMVWVAISSFFLWGQHFLAAAPSAMAWMSSLWSALTVVVVSMLLIQISLGLRRADPAATPALPFARYALVLLVVAVLSGFLLSSLALNPHLHNTLFVTAHVHIITAGAMLLTVLGGLHLAHLGAPETRKVRDGAALLTAGVLLTFLPLLVAGMKGALRREYSYSSEFQPLHILASAGATILAYGLVRAALTLRHPR